MSLNLVENFLQTFPTFENDTTVWPVVHVKNLRRGLFSLLSKLESAVCKQREALLLLITVSEILIFQFTDRIYSFFLS